MDETKTRRGGAGLPATLFRLLASLFTLAAVFATPVRAEIVLSDAAGREVRLAGPAQRIATNESLILMSLALVDPDPVARIAGWAAPQRIDRGFYDAYRRRFPAIDAIPAVGGVLPAKTSVEAILSVKPDLFVVSIWEPGWAEATATLEAAGVPVLFLDGPVNDGKGPAETAAFSVETLAQAVGQEAKGKAFGDFLRGRFKRITDRTAALAPVSVLVDAHAGATCCSTPGKDNRMTDYLRLAGGRSIGADVPGYDGKLSPEAVLGADPAVYIATGGPHLAAQGGLVLGGGIDAQAAKKSLADILGKDIRGALAAVREGRAHAVSHQLSISVLNILVFECFAKWMHPAVFADVDPAETLAEINRTFLTVPLEGTFWID
ncbi:ABC transporter substrate-binding protein [Shinella curvata]|uniref:ABC transporter substrate-binding protein n=1 Tax=Shinella curvata TaxID=1817964 RepID=A0ABT8XEQ9_9HYPH|nr:ABC transporter substrate-binding protein [Shinella curvata]MCJ8052889.1 ABC transporter substrate-binding protein [Shinella curvata]MDO6122220.1 ABC transporter substrate-binding protein [Shinella curvata]